MSWLLIVGLKNALLVAPLAVLALGLSRWTKRPALAHLVWVLVLIKLVTPPLVDVPVGWRLDFERWLALTPANAVTPTRLPRPGSQEIPATAAVSLPIADADSRASSTVVGTEIRCDAPAQIVELAADADRSADAAVMRATDNRAARAVPAGDSGTFSSACCSSVIPQTPAAWFSLAAAGWLAGSAWLLGLMVFRVWRFQRFLQRGGRRDERLERRVRRLAAVAGLSAQPRVVVVSSAVSPMLWGLGARATLVFPAALRDRLTAEEIDSLLLHELAHFARGDHWVRMLELVTHVLYWWHPVVWLARRQIEVAEETCCDAWVVQHQSGSPRSYAEALLATIDFLSERAAALPPAACGLGDVPFLKQRLTQIVRGQTTGQLSRTATVLVACAGLVLSPLEPALWATSSPRIRATATPRQTAVIAVAPQPPPAPEPIPPLEDHPPGPAPEAVSETATMLPAPVDLILTPPPAQWAAATSPNGRYKLVARTGRKITLQHEGASWRLDLSAHGIGCVSFSPDSASFVTGHDDGFLRWWDSGTGGLLADPLPVGSSKITSVALSPDGQHVACGTAAGRVSVWDLASAQEVSHLDAAATIGCVRWSPTTDDLAISVGNFAAAEHAALLIWDPASPAARHELALAGPAGAIAWLTGDTALLAADWSGQSVVWTFDAETLTPGERLPKDVVSAAAWSPDCPLRGEGFVAGEFIPGAAE